MPRTTHPMLSFGRPYCSGGRFGLLIVLLACLAGCGAARDIQERTQHISEETVKKSAHDSARAAESKFERNAKPEDDKQESDQDTDEDAGQASSDTTDGSTAQRSKPPADSTASTPSDQPRDPSRPSDNASDSGNRTAGVTRWTHAKPSTFDGPACSDVFYQPADYQPGTTLDKTEADLDRHVLLMSCTQHVIEYQSGAVTKDRPQNPKVAPLDLRALHLDFDDRHVDHLAAALMSVYAEFGFPPGLDGEISYPSRPLRGIAYAYAKRIDPGRIRDRLADTSLPADAIDTFMALLKASIDGAESRRTNLDDAERRILYEIPAEVVDARVSHYQTYTDIYDRLDTLTAEVESALSGNSDRYTLAKKLAHLRGDFLRRCDNENCLLTPEYQRISHQLRLVYLAERDATALYAERMAYDEPKSRQQGPLVDLRPIAHHIQYARRQAAYPMYRKYRSYTDARDSGASHKAALAMVGGGPMLETSPYELTVDGVDLELPSLAETLDTAGPIEDERATVKEIERSDRTARLIFVQQRQTRYVPYNCKETDKIERITPEGRIVYRTECQWKETTTESAEFPPVTIPAYEADAIKPGDDVRFAVIDSSSKRSSTEHTGHVIRVFRNGEVIQLRDHAFGD